MNPYTSKPYSQNYYEILKIRKALPVYGYKEEFLEILDKNKCVIVTSETGSGKSTQIPQWCLEYSEKYNQNKKIVCTQPRVFAATALAHRVAKEIDVEVGTVIGYHVRFNKSFNNSTRLIYMTSGVLLNKLTSDISANDYHIIIVDEAHERQIESDTLLGLLVYALRSRDNLKVIIMSATIEAEKFQKLFDNAPILQMPGKTYPVEIVYYDQCKSTDDYLLNNGIYEILEIVSKLVCEIHSNPLKKGDILVFLTGKDDIIKTEHMISSSLINKKDYIILHAHAELNLLELRKIHQKSTKRKIILATNMAQTSLTIDNIVFIIDCGFVKESHWNYKQRINELPIIRISKACAKQRAGRTGRVCPGICYRLYSKEVFNEMNESPKCQLECANIESLFLRMKRIVNVDFLFFEFIDPIPQEKLSKTFESLHYYGALQLNEEITELGLQINAFPLEPCHAIILIKSFTYNCYDSIIPIIAMLQKENIFIRPTTQNTALYEKSKKKIP